MKSCLNATSHRININVLGAIYFLILKRHVPCVRSDPVKRRFSPRCYCGMPGSRLSKHILIRSILEKSTLVQELPYSVFAKPVPESFYLVIPELLNNDTHNKNRL